MSTDLLGMTGNIADAMAEFFASLQLAGAGGPRADYNFREAMVALVRLQHRVKNADPTELGRLESFRRESAQALASYSGKIAAYVHKALILAEGANEDEWYELCKRRSVIQILLDEHKGSAAISEIDPEILAELDQQMRRVGEDQGPLSEEHIPHLSLNHWWWRFPQADNTQPRPACPERS